MEQDDFNELPLPQGPENQIKRQTFRHLPNFFRTDSNKKFLGGTVDVITQPGTLTRLSSYIGRRDIPNYSFDDVYIQETSTPRQYYQLEPAFVNEDPVTGKNRWYGDYIDYINSLKYFGADVVNHSKLNKQESYTWNPHIDWDKFTNYPEYYWIASGPDPVTIYGQMENIVSEFTVTSIDQIDNRGYIFTPDGLTVNPRLTLYRGVTYKFNINTPHMKFAIKTENDPSDGYFYNIGVSARNVEKGIVTFTVPYEAPDLLYYMDNTIRENLGISDSVVGMIDIKDIKEASALNVETEILGKKNFKSSNGIEFINGLKVKFAGNVTPSKYAKGFWYVEGVGNRIVLINTLDLEAPATFIKGIDVPWDDQGFDTLPFENADNYPLTKDYLVINRASRDRNNWARTNRWFHRTVLEVTANANGQIANLDQSTRANRPIIEFEPDLKLFNHGYFAKPDVDLVDTVTTDVFSTIEGSAGYIVDGEQLLPGYRVLFTADPDITVQGRIFEVKRITNVYENVNIETPVVSISSFKNIIKVANTFGFRPGTKVQFIGNVAGGLSSTLEYYVIKENFNSTSLSVSLVKGGDAVVLTDAINLSMKMIAIGVARRKSQLTLQEVKDTDPVEGQIAYVTKGKNYRGTSFYYQDGKWHQAQKKTDINQAPMFDLFDESLVSYSDKTVYPFSTFKGTPLFNYKVSEDRNQKPDSELGFPLVYRAIDNVGDIEFEFSLQKGSWSYELNNELTTVNSYEGYLRKWNLDNNFSYTNGWVKTDRPSEQNVVRVLKVESQTNLIPVDVFDDTPILYALEQANHILNGNQFYMAIQDNSGRELSDTDYWLPYQFKDQYKEDFDFDTKYAQRDIVKYRNLYYIALEDVKGQLPTNTDFWKLIFQGYKFKGEFNRLGTYQVDDIVTYNSYTYIAIRDNNGQNEPTDVIYWKLLVKGPSNFQGEFNLAPSSYAGEFSLGKNYFVNNVVNYNNTFYIAVRNSANIDVTNTNYWEALLPGSYNPETGLKKTVTYKAKDIVSYGLYLYLSIGTENTGNLPTDTNYWMQLSSGSTFPVYYNTGAMYHTGQIVALDARPKIDYRIRVYVNDVKRTDLSLNIVDGVAYITFDTPLSPGDKVVYKIRSISNKNVKGYYEIPLNWQNNPFNETLDTFSFGEVLDHTKTIVENSPGFTGKFPGINNLSNLGPISQYGRKFMQHTGPMSLSAFLMIDKKVNIIKALQWCSREYTQFKKDIVFRMQTSGYDGTPRDIADQLLQDYSKSKNLGKSAFYFSDMVPYSASSVREYSVDDPRFPIFSIDSLFNPLEHTRRAILVYLNEVQLLYGKDYEFDTEDAFIKIIAPIYENDIILIKDYNTTNGCYVPLTPSKLGLYPLYEPMIYLDTTYRKIVLNDDGTESTVVESRKVIQGHDGSLFTAYNDYRDEVLLEIEKRIFNNTKVHYDPEIFDVNDVMTGYYRRTDFTKAEINDILITEFLRWNQIPSLDFNSPELRIPVPGIDLEKTPPRYKWVDGDSFTYNYNKSYAPNGVEELHGYWRGVYKYFYDTDRPHTHPWEMQGFSIKPMWWDEVYGLAPYTCDNVIMWDAIEKGQIGDPNNPRINTKYARPGLSLYIPVDSEGNLLSPIESGLAYNFSKVNSIGRYTFGDQAPVETAWRQSSEYPFAVMIVMCTLRGAEFIGKMWDRFTIKRDITGQIYSTVTKKKLNTAELPFANELQEDGTRTFTSGLANIIDEYVLIYQNIDYDYYKKLIRGLDVKLRYRVSGFTSKEKIKVLLDSRTPNSSGTVFLPSENYKIFYNKSAPVETVTYSGVIIEKSDYGYAVTGYDSLKSVFEIFPARLSASDVLINVGGISDSYVDWAPGQYYVSGQLVKIQSNYYRALLNHTSSISVGEDIDAKKWQKLQSLPITGGRDAYVRTKFINVPVKVPYGTVFTDIQSVVDFLLGYQARLRDWGFQFDDFSNDLNLPLNWLTSAKEFMFWTLQNWVKGSVITLSPAANNLKFKPTINASVDTLDSDFYEYSIFKADGSPLKTDLTNVYREENGFTIKPSSDTQEGIFHLRTSLVYQEHVILFDNVSIFNDVVYDVVPGYRQGRLKLIGFKTNNWDGSYYTPGFMYDNAEIFEWQPNTDYNIGDVVEYQSFYYTAIAKANGTTDFDYTKWSRLSEKPEPKLEPNLDYRIDQFRDFYSLESSNFDSNQQALARHLTGYQPRQYLEDIIIDDVSQYKFYQGFIKEKGTLNSITKLFDALRTSGYSNIDVKEEWAFKVSDFGASDAYVELEFVLDETKFRHNPQNVVLTLASTEFDDSAVYNITVNDTAKKTISYDANPFVTKALDFTAKNYGVFKYRTAGYVNPANVDHIVYDENALLNYDLTLLKHKDKIWIGNTPNGEWNVLEYYNTRALITSWERINNVINLSVSIMPNLLIGDLISITNLELLNGIYKVAGIYSNLIQVYTNNPSIGTVNLDSTHGVLFKFEQVRYRSASAITANHYSDLNITGECLWIDQDFNNRWKVLENTNPFNAGKLSPPNFLLYTNSSKGSEVKISGNGKYLYVSAIGIGTGNVLVYTRPNNLSEWVFLQTLSMPAGFTSGISSTEKFGYSIDVSYDARLLVISAPDVSAIKSLYAGEFDPNSNYAPTMVVRYLNQLWQAKNYIYGDGSTIDIFSQDWELLRSICPVYEGAADSGLTKQGAVFVYVLDPGRRIYERDTLELRNEYNDLVTREQIICSYHPLENERFGTKVRLAQYGNEYWLYVSSEYVEKIGAVQVFIRRVTGTWEYNLDQQYLNFDYSSIIYNSPALINSNSLYGYDVTVGGIDNNRVAISAPFLNGGAVYVFNKNGGVFNLIKIIDQYTIADLNINSLNNYQINNLDYFGYSISMKGEMLFVSSPNNDTKNTNVGVVYRFNSIFVLEQIIVPPLAVQNERFGTKIDTDISQNILVVTSAGGNTIMTTAFDTYIDRAVFTNDSTRNYVLDTNSLKAVNATTFDAEATAFYDRVAYTGAAYTYDNLDRNYIYGNKLTPVDQLVTNDNFGSAISVVKDSIVVGAPQRQNGAFIPGIVYTFDFNSQSWLEIASQGEVVDVSKFKKAFVYNTSTNKLVDNLDIIDPLKGYIAGPADQEIMYQTMRDPAVYTYTAASIVKTDQSDPWLDEHVGELWWDLSRVKWIWYEQGNSSYRNSYWNVLFPGSSIDIYEWTETTLLPSEWLAAATSNDALLKGISGTPIYINDLTYSTKQKYDTATGYLTTYYYYWVKNKTTVPRVKFRSISAADVAQLIFDPSAVGYKYIAVTGSNSLSLVNIKPDIYQRDINLNIQYYQVDNDNLIVHREYALIAANDATSIIPAIIENKWIDSLCGDNIYGQIVPDPRLSLQQRYGTRNEPRQGWFANRREALKQYIEYLNSILLDNQIVDTTNFEKLNEEELPPTIDSGKIDQIVDIVDDLRFIGTLKIKTAKAIPVIKDGQILVVIVTDPGYGYKVAPTIKLMGTGTGATLKSVINENGSIIRIDVIQRGSGYDSYSATISIRNYSVLVKVDDDSFGSWSVYDWSGDVTKNWYRIKTQGWNVKRYWNYADWYAIGYNAESKVGFTVDQTVNLEGLNSQVGDLVKVNNVGGHWLLLRRISELEDPNYTVTYEVVGKQNATIQFSKDLYNMYYGYDSLYSYDKNLYDQGPGIELRIILNAVRDNILTDELRIEYINIFFNSVKYALTEHMFVDWVFKSSFIKINHNVGTLKQRITYQSDMLSSYQKYIEEVKPYKTKIREFTDTYNYVDPSNQQTTDFDLFSYYNPSSGYIERTSLRSAYIDSYPWKNWLDNYLYEVDEIIIHDQGNGYVSIPKVIISGDGRDASATAYIAKGKVIKIVVDNPGYGYSYSPSIFISGGNGDDDNNRAKAVAIIGNHKVRTNLIGMKYDRISLSYTVTDFTYTDTFSGTGVDRKFKLTYAPDIKKVNFNILVNDVEIYGSLFDVSIVQTMHDTYSALEGYVIFKDAPTTGVNNVVISYKKNIALFNAADRINDAYEPTVGQYGKELGQLMAGVDYGGVQVTSIDFDVGGGWDVLPWDAASWDNVLSTNDDFVVVVDGSTRTFALPYIPAAGVIINVYVNNKRIDDPYYNVYDGTTVQPNGLIEAPLGRFMNSFVGDSIHNEITIPLNYNLNDNDYITFRKSTSDGTILPTDQSLIDSFVQGGDLAYTTAQGVKAEEIIIDGDSLITSDTSHGPEELVQGSVVDTLDFKVYHTPSDGGPSIYVYNLLGNGVDSTFSLTQLPETITGTLLIVNNVALELTVDYQNKTFTIYRFNYDINELELYVPPVDSQIAIISIDTAGYDITEKTTFIGDGSSIEYLTSSNWNNGDVSGFITINGEPVEFDIKESNDAYDAIGNVVIEFRQPPADGDLVVVMLFRGKIQKWSEVKAQYIPVVADTYVYSLNRLPANLGPLSANTLVIADTITATEFLQSPDLKYYTYDGTNTLFINDLRYISNSIKPGDLNVYVNGIKIVPIRDYLFDTVQMTVTMNPDIVSLGDEITIEILYLADYWIDSGSIVISRKNYSIVNQKTLIVNTFTNHDVLKTKRKTFGFSFAIGYDVQPYDVTQYDLTNGTYNTSGIFDLPRKIASKSGVLVILNRKILTPNVDYVVLDNLTQIRVILPDQLSSSSYLEVVTTNDKVVKPSYGFRVFKDMLNRTSYKRLDRIKTTKLRQDLTYLDTHIVVYDGSVLPVPVKETNLPGIIFINGERIEYFVKEGNTLSQLRRGTLGTGTKNYYPQGTMVENMGAEETVPYSDEENKSTFYGDGTTQIFYIDMIPQVAYNTVADDSTVDTNWYRETIPWTYGQCDQIEVFVAGKRLSKAPYKLYDQALGQDSYNGNGDKFVEADFSVTGLDYGVRLTKAPEPGELVVIVYKTGRLWQNVNENASLVHSDSDIAKFLTAAQVNLPK
jgi:hypothetical protein